MSLGAVNAVHDAPSAPGTTVALPPISPLGAAPNPQNETTVPAGWMITITLSEPSPFHAARTYSESTPVPFEVPTTSCAAMCIRSGTPFRRIVPAFTGAPCANIWAMSE